MRIRNATQGTARFARARCMVIGDDDNDEEEEEQEGRRVKHGAKRIIQSTRGVEKGALP